MTHIDNMLEQNKTPSFTTSFSVEVSEPTGALHKSFKLDKEHDAILAYGYWCNMYPDKVVTLKEERTFVVSKNTPPPQPTYKPWTQDTFPRDAWFKMKDIPKPPYRRAVEVTPGGLVIVKGTVCVEFISWGTLLEKYVQLDGTPCGVKE